MCNFKFDYIYTSKMDYFHSKIVIIDCGAKTTSPSWDTKLKHNVIKPLTK